MFGLNYEDIINKIKEGTGKSDEEIESLVNQKIKKLGDLISKEGAAHIIANEFNIKLHDKISRRINIKDLVVGMNSVDLLGKVIDIYAIREFKTAKREGRVASLLLGDNTGIARVVIWDSSLIKELENNLQKEKVIEIKNAYIKDNNGFKEIHLGNKAKLNFNCSEDIEINLNQERELKKIKDLLQNDNVRITGTIVQIFEPRIYEGCSECKRKVSLEDGNYKCPIHGNTELREIPVINISLDDGTDTIRAVLFDENYKKLVKDIKGSFEELKGGILGRQVEITGNVKKNEMFDRLEIFVSSIEEINPEYLSQQILEEMKIG